MKPIFSLLILAPLLTSCAVMSEKECRHADWESIGYVDGTNGETLAQLSERADACAEHGIAVNRDDYFVGRSNGLDRFCTYESGLRFGENGNDYLGLCIDRNEEAFMQGYEIGSTTYHLRSAALQLSSRIDAIDYRLERLNEKRYATIDSCSEDKKPTRKEKKDRESKRHGDEKSHHKQKHCRKIAKYTDRQRAEFSEQSLALYSERSSLRSEYDIALEKLAAHKASY